jgi:hypothetical protein
VCFRLTGERENIDFTSLGFSGWQQRDQKSRTKRTRQHFGRKEEENDGDIPSSNERPVSRRRFICRQSRMVGGLARRSPLGWKRYEQFSRLSPFN